MKKCIIFTLLIILIQSCIYIDERDDRSLDIDSFISCIIYTTDTTETRHISVCSISYKDVSIRYVYKHREVIKYDTILIARDTVLQKYIIERYAYDTIESETRMSPLEYKDFLKESQINYEEISDTVVLYQNQIWDKRILNQMYNIYVKDN